ncbi:MAG: hypothetical protein Q8Q73_17240 [Stagnimonas sp.]|nr:hypothetical protein [Stagnimonas sp.]
MSALAIRLPELLPSFRPTDLRSRRTMPRPELLLPRRIADARPAASAGEPVGVAWAVGQNQTLHWCWAETPALLLRRLAREIPAQVLRFSEAGHGLGILLRVAADELDARGVADPSRILALAAKLRPWVCLRWCGSQAELRQGQGAFAAGYVNAFLGWDGAVEDDFQPEVPSYRLAEFLALVSTQ